MIVLLFIIAESGPNGVSLRNREDREESEDARRCIQANFA